MSDVRQRKKGAASTNTPAARAKAEDAAPFSILDIARSLVFLLIASSALSYFVTKDSFIWGVKRPQWTRLEVIKSYIVSCPSLAFLALELPELFLLPTLGPSADPAKTQLLFGISN
jgi:hypothetical protein